MAECVGHYRCFLNTPGLSLVWLVVSQLLKPEPIGLGGGGPDLEVSFKGDVRETSARQQLLWPITTSVTSV